MCVYYACFEQIKHDMTFLMALTDFHCHSSIAIFSNAIFRQLCRIGYDNISTNLECHVVPDVVHMTINLNDYSAPWAVTLVYTLQVLIFLIFHGAKYYRQLI